MNASRLVAIVTFTFVAACGPLPTLVSETPGAYQGIYYERTWLTETNMDIRPYQTREFETSKRQAFDATRSALEEAGYVIKEADYESGVLQGKVPPLETRPKIRGRPVSETATVAIGTINKRRSTVRIDFVISLEYTGIDRDLNIIREGIRKPVVYQQVFDDIQELLLTE